MNIIINTDASFCPNTKAGGYAFWIKSDNVFIQKSGTFKNKPNDSLDAEIMAIGNALYYLLKNINFSFNLLVINTDSLPAISHIHKGVRNCSKPVKELYQTLIEGKVNQIDFRHVKAHTNNGNARSYVNNWCDTEAKKQMQKARKKCKP